MVDFTKLGRRGQRTLMDALREGVVNEGPAFRRALVNGADDAAVLLSGQMTTPVFNPAALPDAEDARLARDAGRAARNRLKRGSGSERDALTHGVGADHLERPVPQVNRVAKYLGTPARPVGKEAGLFETLDRPVELARTGAEIAGGVQMVTELVLPVVVAPVAGWVAGDRARQWLRKPGEYLNPQDKLAKGQMTPGGHLNNGMMFGFSAIAAYGMARGFSQNLDSLRHMYAEMTGTRAENVSTLGLLTSGDAPELVKQARGHLLREYIGRGAVQALSLGLIGRAMWNKKIMGMKEFLIPMGAGVGLDIVMGESALPFFAGVTNAHKAGQDIPPQAYAEFLLAADPDLKRRGAVGRRVAHALGVEYAAAHVSPTDILLKVEASLQAHKRGEKGGIDEDIQRVIAKAEAHQAKAPQAPAPSPAQPEARMAETSGGRKPRGERAVHGKYTRMIRQEQAQAAPAGGVTVS